jgi:hypothetical protein
MYWDRFDICEAYAIMEWHWSSGGWLHERPSNQRRMEATAIQLHRIGFGARPSLEYETLSENGKEIYHNLEDRYGFPSTRSELEAEE